MYDPANPANIWKLTDGVDFTFPAGQSLAAGALVHAIHSGHEWARRLDRGEDTMYLRDIPVAEFPPGPVI